MPTEYVPTGGDGLFPITVPDDADSPNAPAQIRAVIDDLHPLLRRAGAQAKAFEEPSEQSRTNTAYGLLGTPDRVQGIVVPAKSLLMVAYLAHWKNSAAGGPINAALFIGANQLKVRFGNGAPAVESAQYAAAETTYKSLTSFVGGLINFESTVNIGDDVETGMALATLAGGVNLGGTYEVGGSQYEIPGPDTSALALVGGICPIRVGPGTYDVSVQFKAASGLTVSAKNRKLYVWTQEFA